MLLQEKYTHYNYTPEGWLKLSTWEAINRYLFMYCLNEPDGRQIHENSDT